jgi:glycosyltransferase involved in cell wall biosynthesis
MSVIDKYDGMVYGPGNDDLGSKNGGSIPHQMQVAKMQEAKAMIYGGTAPASYTLSFIEAMMLGLPIVAISKKLAHIIYDFDFYEVDEILAQIGGLVCDDVGQMFEKTKMLLDSDELAKDISEKQRALAIEMFGKKNIIKQWDEFLNSI